MHVTQGNETVLLSALQFTTRWVVRSATVRTKCPQSLLNPTKKDVSRSMLYFKHNASSICFERTRSESRVMCPSSALLENRILIISAVKRRRTLQPFHFSYVFATFYCQFLNFDSNFHLFYSKLSAHSGINNVTFTVNHSACTFSTIEAGLDLSESLFITYTFINFSLSVLQPSFLVYNIIASPKPLKEPFI